jgi:triphosphoribosyl-dephospho-CoA synthase
MAVGERIEAAVRAAWQATGCNTNLGIVLLCAPLLAAFEQSGGADGPAALRRALTAVLQSLDVADARAAYRAIALARPGGLGRASEQDVALAPTVGLRAAMALAAHRDRIAWQYLHAYPDVFDLGLPVFLATQAAGSDRLPAEVAAGRALQAVFLEFVAGFPDSHIVRKHGAGVAQCVMDEALPWRARARRGELLDADPAFAPWDEDLKARGLNPGTSADLCVAVALAAALACPPPVQFGGPGLRGPAAAAAAARFH